jgi:aryl-alcohol dehydrogenase-like predicted oxidoreductase
VRQRTLGDVTVTAVGLGDVSLVTADRRGLDARDVERAVTEALELGITLVDVAPEEAAERGCADVVRTLRLRDRVVLATRVPQISERFGVPIRDTLQDRLPPPYVQERVEATLRATKLDALSFVQLPLRVTWRASSAWPELVGTCARLVREGKVMRWGAIVDPAESTGRDGEPDLATQLADEPWLVGIQAPFNLCDRTAEPLVASKLTILARHPLAGGALAGILGPGVRLMPRDDRNSLDAAALEQIAIGAAHLAALVRHEPPAARSCAAARSIVERQRRPEDVEASSAGELALRFVLDRGAIALPRLHRRDHLVDAMSAALAPPLSAALVARLDALFAPPSEIPEER